MKQKLFLTLLIAVLSAFCISSCSSEEMIETSIDEEVIASAEPRMVDSSDELNTDVDSCGHITRPANILDSATFYKAFGKYMSPVERVIAEATPIDAETLPTDTQISRTDTNKKYDIRYHKSGSMYVVTIFYGNLSIKYFTYYLYEFPQYKYNLKEEYIVNYTDGPNEYSGDSYVHRPDIYRLSVSVDLFIKNGDHKYEQTSTGISIRIEGKKFIIVDSW